MKFLEKILAFVLIVLFSSLKLMSQGIDTLYPPSFNQACFDEGLFVYFDNSGQGPIFGNNGYGDLEKAQLLSLPVSGNGLISDVIVHWGYKRVGANGSVRCKAYASTVFGAPGDLKGTSNSFFVSAVDTNSASGGGFTVFSFSSPLSFTDNFIVSVDFSSLLDGDTLSVLSTEKGCGSGCIVYEKWNDGSWHNLCSVWGITDIDMAVEAVVDWTANPVSPIIEQYAEIGKIVLQPAYPNPATDVIQIPYYLKSSAKVSLQFYNENGNEMHNELSLGWLGAGDHTLDMDISLWPKGNYFYRIIASEDILNARFQKF